MTRARPTLGFLLLFALAWSGGAIAYVPLLTLLLPERLSQVAGAGDVWWLAVIGVGGALCASAANLGFGWLSDLSGARRPWVAVGLVGTVGLLAPIAWADTGVELLVAVVVWQAALNLLLAPLAAWAADRVPDAQRGRLGGVFGIAPAAAAGVGALIVGSEWGSLASRLASVGALVALCVVPILLPAERSRGAPAGTRGAAFSRSPRDLALVLIARLAVQMAQATLFSFLFYILRVLPGERVTLAQVSTLFSVVLFASVPATFALAALADRTDRRGAWLVGCCVAMSVGLVAMAAGLDRASVFAGYAVFGLASATFLALQSGYAMLLLPSPGRHGRDLGLLNLANTLPNVAGPALTLLLVERGDFTVLLTLCAALTLGAGALVARVQWSRPLPSR